MEEKLESFKTACVEGDIDAVKHLLNEKIDVNAKFDWGYTALMLASQANKLEVVKLLCENGADIDARNESGETAFLKASSENALDIMKLLFYTYKCDLNVKDTSQSTALFNASCLNHFEQVKFLVENGADIEARIYYGLSPLMNAAGFGFTEIAGYLLDNGANIEGRIESDGRTPIFFSLILDNPEMFYLLIERKADIYAKDYEGMTLLSAAASLGRLEAVKYLLEKNIDVNSKETNGHTALSRACENGNTEMVKFLCSNNATINYDKSEDGKTLLRRVCATDESFELASFFFNQKDCNFDINAQDDQLGYSALTAAVEKGNLDTVQLLVEHKADKDVIEKNGKTLLMIASQNGKLDLVKYLVENGASVSAQDNDGCTALMIASEKDSNFDVVKYLYENNASIYERDNKGFTAIMKAAENYNANILKYFAEKIYGGLDLTNEPASNSNVSESPTSTSSPSVLQLLLTNKTLTYGLLGLAVLYAYLSRK